MVSPSAQGPRQGLLEFTLINSAVEVAIACSAKNSNSFAIFNPSTSYECDFAPTGGEVRDDDWCWADSATLNFDTTVPKVYNLTVKMSWSCENEGVYALSTWSLLDLDCGSWSCENEMWPKYNVCSNSSTLCMPGSLNFLSAGVNVLKLD
ncbi:hypothetical protein GT037_007560 [Alternaria burnsii]|uniref:AA1-like domain-containing protein n=1 Tax=Alternaria burnsii TaxID=1187904 RepID=A0A8H7ECM2_9PLEO|nr:uncharacterized protein GT037_007560 [Alternaria burnsii]KAF7674800.1 hypothetical protein GT037_007560 [Alternaria burnsii]